ncbi:MAG TPA: 4Fe-4S binding protein [Dehalococcoidia bacterium]|nr:4Fe-4S binding protein [Dehalococcoidia bacterium]
MLQINEETCTQCGICATVCSFGLIEIEGDNYPEEVPEADQFCNRCGACVVACPAASVNHLDIPLEQSMLINPGLETNFDQCAQLIKTRRSIRVYGDEPVSREIISRLIDTARYAPTGANQQNVKWLVIYDKEKMKRIREIGADFVLETVKANFPTYAQALHFFNKRREAGYDIFLHGAPAIVCTYGTNQMPAPSTNCIIALSYFDLLANSASLSCCWLGFFTNAANNFNPIKEIVALPPENEVYASMIVGYPRYQYQRIPVRNPADIIWR